MSAGRKPLTRHLLVADNLLNAETISWLDGNGAKMENGPMSDTNEATNGKTRRRQTGKPVSEQTVKKTKSTIHLSREADQRLDIHCTMMGFDRSALVEKLINDNLKRYVVSDRGKPNIDEETAG